MVCQGASISGIPQPGSPTETRAVGKTTAALGMQQAVYELSKAVFNYAPYSAALDHALVQWTSKQTKNSSGVVPELFSLESRVGASLAVLGYLQKSQTAGLTSIVATSEVVQLMEPALSQHLDSLAKSKVVFQVGAVEYDAVAGELTAPISVVGRVAKQLGLPLIVSSLAVENDAYNSSVLASVIGANTSPAFHVFDGLRGTHQPVTQKSAVEAVGVKLPKASSLLDSFRATNEVLNTKLSPFEYFGPAEPHTVFVTLGNPEVFARQSSTDGVMNVRLYSPFLAEEFRKVLPSSAIDIVVVGEDLYKDVNASLRLYYGLKAGPNVMLETTNEITNVAEFETKGAATIKVWDSDKSATCSAVAWLAAPVPEVSAYTKFDNFVAGGITETDIRFGFNNQYWDLRDAQTVVVNDTGLLKQIDVVAGAAPGAKLVIAAASEEALNKIVPAQTKLNAAAKELDVYFVDYSQIDSTNTQGRTLSMAAQALLWHLAGTDVDTATSRVVHANSVDTELIAATVNKIVITLLEKSLVRLSDDARKEWLQVEVPEKEVDTVDSPRAKSTSFVPVSTLLDGDTVSGDADPVPGADVDEAGSLGLKKRLIFKEAFEEHEKLRPEVPAKTYIARVKHNQRVTPETYDRNIFQLELDITGTGMKYALGEAIGIHAPNNEELVLEFLKQYGVNPQEVFGISVSTVAGDDGSKAYRTAFQFARDYLDLFGKAPKRFYESLMQYASDDAQRHHLERLGGSDGAPELKKRSEEKFESYVDVLNEFSSARPPFAALLDLVSPLKRREYSIASSQKVHPNEVHLLVVVVDWVTSTGEKRFGQCSKYLSDLKHGAEVVVSVKPSVMKLPKDPITPVIMAGLGTGLAPFKAFLEEKMMQREQGHEVGPVYLFLGSRHKREEYLYGELFEAYRDANLLTYIGAAFSRDQPEKIYIQHRIKQAQAELVDAFVHKKGNFYLCGPTWPVADISAALTDIVLAGAVQTGKQINEATLIEDLKENERYILEVY